MDNYETFRDSSWAPEIVGEQYYNHVKQQAKNEAKFSEVKGVIPELYPNQEEIESSRGSALFFLCLAAVATVLFAANDSIFGAGICGVIGGISLWMVLKHSINNSSNKSEHRALRNRVNALLHREVLMVLGTNNYLDYLLNKRSAAYLMRNFSGEIGRLRGGSAALVDNPPLKLVEATQPTSTSWKVFEGGDTFEGKKIIDIKDLNEKIDAIYPKPEPKVKTKSRSKITDTSKSNYDMTVKALLLDVGMSSKYYEKINEDDATEFKICTPGEMRRLKLSDNLEMEVSVYLGKGRKLDDKIAIIALQKRIANRTFDNLVQKIEVERLIIVDQSASSAVVKLTDSTVLSAGMVTKLIARNKRLLKNKKQITTLNTPAPQPQPAPVIEPEQNHTPIQFVQADLPNSYQTDTYPIIGFPAQGTVIRSYRQRTPAIRGYTETAFQDHLDENGGSEWQVLGDVYLATSRFTRAYEPDIAIIDHTSNEGIRIDIEIDEPYSGFSRLPIHLKGDSRNRDRYFLDRGWAVVRFSERQVHEHRDVCLRIIKYVHQMMRGQERSETFENLVEQIGEPCWDHVQASQWARERFREGYLDHNFEEHKIATGPAKAVLTTQETKEEGHVVDEVGSFARNRKVGNGTEKTKAPPSEGGMVFPPTAPLLFTPLKHNRDKHIRFEEDTHSYFVHGVPTPSVTTMLDRWFPPFDEVYWSERKATENTTPAAIRLKWEEEGEKAAALGTQLHEDIRHDRVQPTDCQHC